MYTVFLDYWYEKSSHVYHHDSVLLYDSSCVNEYIKQLQSPALVIDKEGGSFSFSIPKEHETWAMFENGVVLKRTSQIIIFENNKWIWEGFITDYNKDLIGNYKVACTGALQYLKNTNFPLENIVNVSKNDKETMVAFAKRALSIFMKNIVTQHNNRINDLNSIGYSSSSSILKHQKIYFDKSSAYSIELSDDIAFPDHFSRIVNFESCYDALQKRIVDDFGGFFYLRRDKVHIDGYIAEQDNKLSVGGIDYLLLLCYKERSEVISNSIVHLGHDLLDYNISEDFDLATAAIPLGDTYDENHPGESRWWLKDERSVFYDITQRANYAWRERQTETHPYYPTGGSRIFLPLSGASEEVVSKYGMRDVILEFDTVVAKYPDVPEWVGDGRQYVIGQVVKYRPTSSTAYEQYDVRAPHTSRDDRNPTNPDYFAKRSSEYSPWGYYMHVRGLSEMKWANKKDYLGETWNDDKTVKLFDVIQSITGSGQGSAEGEYIQEYMCALRILAEDYLTNQQFNKLVLDISVSKISSSEDGEDLDVKKALGNQLPVSASLFGDNAKPYEISSISVQLNDDSQSRMTLGGEETKITNLVSTK